MHGGGFFCNDHRIGLGQQLDTAERLGATLISVGYRLAPEHPYPAQINDAYAGLLWVADHADELGVDPERIVVTGYSAGGGLSAALALTVRDKGGPRLLGQLLMAPMLDDRNDSASAMQMDAVEFWNRSHNGFGWRSLLGGAQGGADVPQYAAPARHRSGRPAARVPRRRLRRMPARRGPRLRRPDLAGRRQGRAARVARSNSRLRPGRPRHPDQQGSHRGPPQLAGATSRRKLKSEPWACW
jgi:acetyl esterase/lipase